MNRHMATNRTHNKNRGVRKAHEARRRVKVHVDRTKQKARTGKQEPEWAALDALAAIAKAEGK